LRATVAVAVGAAGRRLSAARAVDARRAALVAKLHAALRQRGARGVAGARAPALAAGAEDDFRVVGRRAERVLRRARLLARVARPGVAAGIEGGRRAPGD